MKKIIVAAAGLFLAGTMASSAFAEQEVGIQFKGDARARWNYQDEYRGPDTKNNFWNSRVRLQWEATSKGGAYAIGRFRLADATWDGTQQTGAGGEGSNLRVDKAYIGVPVGYGVVEAGLVQRDLTKWFEWDTRADSLQYIVPLDNQKILVFYEKVDEYEEDEEGSRLESDAIDDNDTDRFGLWYNYEFNSGWNLIATGLYQDDQQASDITGFAGAVHVDGEIRKIGLEAELAMKEADLSGGEDDAFGGYVRSTFAVGAAEVGAMIGFTADGYEADGDFGYVIMLSDDNQIATGNLIGYGGDTTFYALSTDFKLTENLGLGFVGAYYDQDDIGDAYEVSSVASYAISDGARLIGSVGYLDQDELDYNPLGFGLSLEIKY